MSHFDPSSSTKPTSTRRTFLTTTTTSSIITTATLVQTPSTSYASSTNDETFFKLYQDSTCNFQVKVPKGWTETQQTLPDRRKIVLFIDPETLKSKEEEKNLVFIAYTPIRDDFTQLSSFGPVEQVGQMTILPKGEIAGKETQSELLSAINQKNAYYFDYTSYVPSQPPQRHFRTIFSIAQGATGGAGSVLVTLTAQCPESRYNNVDGGGGLKGVFDQIVDSYGVLK